MRDVDRDTLPGGKSFTSNFPSRSAFEYRPHWQYMPPSISSWLGLRGAARPTATLGRFVVYYSSDLIISGRAPGRGPEGTGNCSSCCGLVGCGADVWPRPGQLPQQSLGRRHNSHEPHLEGNCLACGPGDSAATLIDRLTALAVSLASNPSLAAAPQRCQSIL